MDINKAIKKQNNSFKRFLLFMGLVFLLLPIILFFSGKVKIFLFAYLCIIEALIVFTTITSINMKYIKFFYSNNKIKLKQGLFTETITINCDRISIIHIEKIEKDLEIVIISKSRFKNNKFKEIGISFLKKYPATAYQYGRIKKLNPEDRYYYIVIKKGGLTKYKFLDMLYKSCMNAVYTEDAMDTVKLFRDKTNINMGLNK